MTSTISTIFDGTSEHRQFLPFFDGTNFIFGIFDEIDEVAFISKTRQNEKTLIVLHVIF